MVLINQMSVGCNIILILLVCIIFELVFELIKEIQNTKYVVCIHFVTLLFYKIVL